MVPTRTSVRLAYKPTGAKSCQRGSFQICQERGYYSVTFGQQSSLLLHQETGRDQKQCPKSRGMQIMGGDSAPQHSAFGPPLDIDQGKFGGRFSLPSQNYDMGIGTRSNNFPPNIGSFQCNAYTGRICIEKNSQTSPVFFMGARPPSSGEGCSPLQMGSPNLHFPPCSPHSQDCEQGEGGKNRSNSNLSPLANSNVVAISSESAVEAPPPPPPIQRDINPPLERANNSVPRASSGLSYFRQNMTKSMNPHELDSEVLDFISNHLSSGSAACYGYAWNKFASYCSDLSIDPFTCSPSTIVKYIHFNFSSGAQYRTLNNIRSTISKFHCGFSGTPAGQHNLVKKALKAAFRLRPPLPKYKDTFDIKPVLILTKQFLETLNS